MIVEVLLSVFFIFLSLLNHPHNANKLLILIFIHFYYYRFGKVTVGSSINLEHTGGTEKLRESKVPVSFVSGFQQL